MSRYDPMFLRELEELEKDKNGDEWAILRTAITLRRLLFDHGQPFINLINQHEKLSLRFEVGEGIGRGVISELMPELGFSDEDIANSFWTAADGLLPETMNQHRRHVLSLPKFLKHIVIQLGNWEYSVKEVIEFCAYYRGIIHPKEPEATDYKNQAFLDWSARGMPLYGFPPEVNLMRHISTIVLRGLEPLRVAVHQRLQP